MAECTVSRCSHERRVFRKELHKWSKEILYILGLERLAEELMGARKWKILVQPFSDLETECPCDWFPEDTCYFCCAKKQPPYDPASGIIPTVENYNALRLDTDEHSASSDQGNLSGSFTSCPSNLSAWHNVALPSGNTVNSSSSLDQPLDLSKTSLKTNANDSKAISSKSQHSRNLNFDDDRLCSKSVLKVPQIPVKPGADLLVLSDIQQLALLNSTESIQNLSQSLSSLKDLKLPLLPDLIRRLAEERIDFERNICQDSDNVEDGSTDVQSGNLSNVILKVPSFKPVKSAKMRDAEDSHLPDVSSSEPSTGASSHPFSGNKGITVTLKELIARSISQKVNWNLENKNIEDDQSIEFPFPSPTNTAGSASWNGECFSKIEKESLSNNISSSADSSKVGKRTRPKRGRYRNYDRDNLARAVRAVQKGEMSVHRAGTFYGVPHSTLEYKVKERHLLRPRKRDIFNCSLLSDGSDPILTSKLTTLAERSKDSKNSKNNPVNVESSGLPNKSLQSHRPTMDSYPSPLSLWQNMPFFSLDFSKLGSDNFFASQMMRKLQENALNEELQKKGKTNDFGIIENIIKSTLEKNSHEHKSSRIDDIDSATVSECKELNDESEI
nr:mushroom body large-type Kenyon cell-specific protein 1 [Parasteatoda tepidariorum]